MRSSAASRARMSIGEALAQLKTEFPDEDIKESKIRFLESEGLVEPERTPSGYRKYSEQDMERLRYILRAQREQYLPLKVIKEHLDAIDRGLEPPPGLVGPVVPRVVLDGDGLPVERVVRSGAQRPARLAPRAGQDGRDHRGAPRAARGLRPGEDAHRLPALRRRGAA